MILSIDVTSPPANLKEVDYSYNKIKYIENCEKHSYLESLNLEGNYIEKITGLSQSPLLRKLSLAKNAIRFIENMECINIESLDLSQNILSSITGLEQLKFLTSLDLSRNKIRRLKGLEENEYLRVLNISGNLISKNKQLVYIENLPLLTELDLCFNPIQTKKYYRLQTLYKIPQLRKLDGTVILAQEKVKAENLNGLDTEDRKAIFKSLLPEEEFIDRRICTLQEIDPESESGEEELHQQMDLVNANPKTHGSQSSLLSSKNSVMSDKKHVGEMMSIELND